MNHGVTVWTEWCEVGYRIDRPSNADGRNRRQMMHVHESLSNCAEILLEIETAHRAFMAVEG